MILPNGKNKKYVEVISGLYILYVILNPILNLENNYNIFDINTAIKQVSGENYISQNEIAKTYILGLENNLKNKIEENGCDVDYVQFYVTPDYNSVEKIDVKMKYGTYFEVSKIQEIIIKEFNIEKNNIKVY